MRSFNASGLLAKILQQVILQYCNWTIHGSYLYLLYQAIKKDAVKVSYNHMQVGLTSLAIAMMKDPFNCMLFISNPQSARPFFKSEESVTSKDGRAAAHDEQGVQETVSPDWVCQWGKEDASRNHSHPGRKVSRHRGGLYSKALSSYQHTDVSLKYSTDQGELNSRMFWWDQVLW